MLCEVCPGSPVHSGNFFCCACRQRPRLTSGAALAYKHLADEEAVADAAAFREWMKLTGAAAEARVSEGWAPTCECLCCAPDLFLRSPRGEEANTTHCVRDVRSLRVGGY